jgi:hypothetical protein
MLTKLFFIALLFPVNYIFAQQTDCKVLKPEIAGTYSGECKKGLAHGKGVAQGIDRYEGQFNKGLPNGKGTYKWASGVYFEGEWKEGVRDGNGKMVYSDSTITGIWKQDKYIGKKEGPPYSIIRSLSVARYTFTKTQDRNDAVKIRIMQTGQDNVTIEDFSMVYDSGTEYRSGNYYGIESVTFPLTVKVKYRAWNQLLTSQFTVIFEFVINDRGSWNVMISN